ncbi:MAG TPA: TrkA family potassium uptake protein [Fimbriimonadaceae bacterium]|jgi:trk system potassium uptake protein TrkA
MKVVIFGCGRTGSTLGLQLASRGHSVTIIEQNPLALRRLGQNHGCQIVIGSGLQDDILESAHIKSADVFFALTRGDNTNIMSAQLVKLKYNVPKVCVKVADPLRAEAYRKLGYFCITPSALAAGMMRDWIIEEPFASIDQYNVLYKELEV